MKLFVIDDSNITYDKNLEFLIFGGMVMEPETIRSAGRLINEIKAQEGIERVRPIKWTNNNWHKKGELNPQTHQKIKDRILRWVGRSNAKIIVYLAPQHFYHDRNTDGRLVINPQRYLNSLKFAINICAQKFNAFLHRENDFGLIMADQFTNGAQKEMCEYCFSLFPDGTKVSRLERLFYPIITVDSETSNVHQVNDIVLGAIQHSLKEASPNLLPIIGDNFLRKDRIINEYGFNLYPKRTQTLRMRFRLEQLENKFNRLIAA